MLLRRIDILHIEPCTAEEGKIRLRAALSDDVTPVMPYLGTVVRTAEYNPSGPSVTLKRRLKVIGLHPREVTVTKLENTTDAWDTLACCGISSTGRGRGGRRCHRTAPDGSPPILSRCGSFCRAPTAGGAGNLPAWRLPRGCSWGSSGCRTVPSWGKPNTRGPGRPLRNWWVRVRGEGNPGGARGRFIL